MKTLTRKELDRQDFVDNEIFELIQNLLPAGRKLKWDIEMIGFCEMLYKIKLLTNER